MRGTGSAGAVQSGDVERLCAWLHAACGVLAGSERHGLLADLLSERTREGRCASARDYLDRMEAAPAGDAERALLLDRVLVHETSFYRAHADLDALLSVLADRPGGAPQPKAPLRLWSAGCAGGQEPFTLAMVLHERFGDAPFDVLGTDVSDEAIRRSREGRFDERQAAALPERLRARYLAPDPEAPGQRRIDPALARRVRFQVHNLVKDPFPGTFDAVFCRNVTIYFDAPTRERVLSGFRASLARPGFLFLGSAASLLDPPEGYDLMWEGESLVFVAGPAGPTPRIRAEPPTARSAGPESARRAPPAGDRILALSLRTASPGAAAPSAGVRAQLSRLLASPVRRIVLDIERTGWLDLDALTDLRRALRALLADGRRVHLVASGAAALRQARKIEPDASAPVFPSLAAAREGFEDTREASE
ncbi:MAG: hypothetical protein HY608_10450 [Planctomycetes bacterium]|nr:hypothetical protein [Planctomycetota bacterium]